jgi:hypothetical protein
MDTENTNDDKAMPPASARSHNTHMATARLSAANTWLQEEIKRLRLTDAERTALRKVLRRVREDYFAGRFADSVQVAAVIDGLLERTK